MEKLCPWLIPIIILNLKLWCIPQRVFLTSIYIDIVDSSNLLDLFFPILSDVCIITVDSGFVKPDKYRPPHYQYLSAICHFYSNNVYLYRNFWSGVHDLLYNIPSTYDGSYVYHTISVGSPVASLDAAVQDATEQAILQGNINSHTGILIP
jgi:hypothetical protein